LPNEIEIRLAKLRKGRRNWFGRIHDQSDYEEVMMMMMMMTYLFRTFRSIFASFKDIIEDISFFCKLAYCFLLYRHKSEKVKGREYLEDLDVDDRRY